MRRLFAILFAVLVPFSGCGVRSFALKEPEVVMKTSPQRRNPRTSAETMAVGSPVRVELRDGRRLKGTFMGTEGDAIVLKVRSGAPEPIAISLADVESLELDTGSNWKAAGIGAAIGVGLFIILVAASSGS
jgi:hypothetical protein